MHYIWLIILSLLGFGISFFIWYKNIKQKKKLICVIGTDCDKVTKSKYGTTFGINNTILGMLYFTFIFVFALLEGLDFSFPSIVSSLRLGISGGAALFSTYLIFVQLGILKEWCEYCLASAVISISIFLILLF